MKANKKQNVAALTSILRTGLEKVHKADMALVRACVEFYNAGKFAPAEFLAVWKEAATALSETYSESYLRQVKLMVGEELREPVVADDGSVTYRPNPLRERAVRSDSGTKKPKSSKSTITRAQVVKYLKGLTVKERSAILAEILG